MNPAIVRVRAKTILGIALENAWEQPGLILHAWVSLAARRCDVAGCLDHKLLYGVWHKDPATRTARYVVGLEVNEGSIPPEGMHLITIPPGRYARLAHSGDMGRIAETYQGLRCMMPETETPDMWRPTFEVYDTTQPIGPDIRVLVHEPVP
jgi:predicted transcriptional regulator YdeE